MLSSIPPSCRRREGDVGKEYARSTNRSPPASADETIRAPLPNFRIRPRQRAYLTQVPPYGFFYTSNPSPRVRKIGTLHFFSSISACSVFSLLVNDCFSKAKKSPPGNGGGRRVRLQDSHYMYIDQRFTFTPSHTRRSSTRPQILSPPSGTHGRRNTYSDTPTPTPTKQPLLLLKLHDLHQRRHNLPIPRPNRQPLQPGTPTQTSPSS